MDETRWLEVLRNKENKCRNYQRQAFDALEKNNNIPNEEQCAYLQMAADLEFEMSEMTRGAERDHHIREKNRLDYKIKEVRGEIDGVSAGPGAKRPASAGNGAAAGGTSGKNDGSVNAGAKSKEEEELDRIAQTWFKEAPRHSFEDVSGMSELKSKLKMCLDDAKATGLSDYLGIPRLNSYFFVGPPGCGKTFIIEAFAHELMDKDYKFISILGSDIISRYVGAAEKSVTRLFEEADKNAPCIVFIDEIDSLCKNRSLPNLPEYAANITTSFLTGYNRIHSNDSEIIFIAATNYPNRVDVAMLDRVELVRVPLPDAEAREAAFRKHFEGRVSLQGNFSFEEMAQKTPMFNYRDIERLTTAIKRTVFREALDLFKDSDKAVQMLSNGKYKLTRTRFMELLEKFKPSPKETILKDLRNWEKDVRSVEQYDDVDINRLYTSNDPLPETEEAPAEQEMQPEPPEEVHTEPVYSLSEQYTIRPDGTAEILFNGAELIGELQVCISGCYIKATPCGDHYSAVYSPEPDETEAEAFVIGEQGYIGNFNVTFTAPISDNAAFDI